jgi:hypothetical protein
MPSFRCCLISVEITELELIGMIRVAGFQRQFAQPRNGADNPGLLFPLARLSGTSELSDSPACMAVGACLSRSGHVIRRKSR